jgi:hypothetical protein
MWFRDADDGPLLFISVIVGSFSPNPANGQEGHRRNALSTFQTFTSRCGTRTRVEAKADRSADP